MMTRTTIDVKADWRNEVMSVKKERILRAIAELDADAYGLRICDEVGAARGSPDQSDTYRLLRRLEADGLIASGWSAPTSERGGRKRRNYALTAAGKAALRMLMAAPEREASEEVRDE